nr:MAG TPA: hypothetical protein [Bacteriophage sp.]
MTLSVSIGSDNLYPLLNAPQSRLNPFFAASCRVCVLVSLVT